MISFTLHARRVHGHMTFQGFTDSWNDKNENFDRFRGVEVDESARGKHARRTHRAVLDADLFAAAFWRWRIVDFYQRRCPASREHLDLDPGRSSTEDLLTVVR